MMLINTLTKLVCDIR